MRVTQKISPLNQSPILPQNPGRISFVGQQNGTSSLFFKPMPNSTKSSQFKVTRSNENRIGRSSQKGMLASSTLPTEGSTNNLPKVRSPHKRDTRVPKKLPLTAAQILEQENLKLVNPSMVLLKHLRMNSEESTQFRMKLIENVLEAKEQFGERVVDPHVKKNIGLINDFYLKLKKKVKTKRAQQDLIRSTSRLGSSENPDPTHESESVVGGSYRNLVGERSLEGLHILSEEEIANPQSVPLDDKLASRLEHIAEEIQKRKQNKLGISPRTQHASFSSAQQSQHSGRPGRKKSMFGSKQATDPQAKASTDQPDIEATPRANLIAKRLKGEDKFLMEVNFLIRMIRESKKEANSAQTQAQKANYLAILERIKSMRGKPEQMASHIPFEALCDSPLKKLKSNLESEKLHAKVQELQTQKETAKMQKKTQKITKMSTLIAELKQKAKYPRHQQLGLRLAQLFDNPKDQAPNGPLLTSIAGKAKRELANHLLQIEPLLVEEISPRDPHKILFEPANRIRDPFVETLRDEYYRQKQMCCSEDFETLQLKRQQLSMPTSELCKQSSDTLKSFRPVAYLLEQPKPLKSFRIGGRLASLPNTVKKSLNSPDFVQVDSEDSNNASNMSGDQELNNLFRELRQIVPVRDSLQTHYRNEHRGLQATLESRVKELSDKVIRRLVKTTK